MRHHRNEIVLVLGFSVAMLLGTSIPRCEEKPAAKPAAVTLKSATPQQYAAVIKSQKGKVVLVDFWATSCIPCRELFPHTIALFKKHGGRHLSVVSMACDEEEDHQSALEFLTKKNATFINLRAAKGNSDETWDAYKIDSGALPHYKLYDRSGKLRHTFTNDAAAKKKFTPADVEAKVRELIAEKID